MTPAVAYAESIEAVESPFLHLVRDTEEDTQRSAWLKQLQKQRLLEEAGSAEGAARFRQSLESSQAKGAGSTTGAAHRLLLDSLDQLAATIQTMLQLPHPQRRGGREFGTQVWHALGAETAAYLTLRVVLDATISGEAVPLTQLAVSVAESFVDELRYRQLKAQAPGLFKYAVEHHGTHLKKHLNDAIDFASVDTAAVELPESKQILLGVRSINLLCESCPDFFECGLQRGEGPRQAKKHRHIVVLSPAIRKQLASQNELLALLRPVLGPMVVKPLPWGPNDLRGGYRFALRGKHRLIRKASKAQHALADAADMPQVYAALNAVQETVWRINQPVLDLVREIVSLGGGFAGLPQSVNTPLPVKPETFKTDPDAKSAWWKEAGPIKAANRLRAADASTLSRVLAVAENVKDESCIYFPHSLDFRGRLYPLASHLSPQGADLSRALLVFANGKPVDAEGARYLAIYGANCFGVTSEGQKVSHLTLDERIQWVEDNEALILETAETPFDTALWWSQADKPLQFLAFCLEWSGYLQACDDGNTPFVSCLPVSMDGTCNGLQHFSALLRDEQGARAVNVTPNERPQDIYEQVARSVLHLLTAEAGTEPLALAWINLHGHIGIMDRKLTKSPVLTYAYGSKKYGFAESIEKYLREHDRYGDLLHCAFGIVEPEIANLRAGCRYLAALIWDVLGETVPAASATMNWMQTVSKGISKRGLPCRWVTPLGFPVRQPYFKPSKRVVSTVLNGRACQSTFYSRDDEKRVDARKQANAISPNVIHSLDASHLMLSVNNCATEGVESFSMVHDSYGCLAADAATMARVLRESFVSLYTDYGNVAAELHRQFGAGWGDDRGNCPSPPPRGSLDLQAVNQSEYFFV